MFYLYGVIIGDKLEVYQVFQLIQENGPALGLHLNVKKNEIWWPCTTGEDPFPADVDRVDNAGLSSLGPRSVLATSPQIL